MAMADPFSLLLPPFASSSHTRLTLTLCYSLPPSRHLTPFPLDFSAPFRPARPFLPSTRTTCRVDVNSQSSIPPVPQSEDAFQNLQSLNADELKASLLQALQGLNRGVFGVPATRKVQIERLIELLEDRNPLPRPTEHLEKVKGEWRLLYSTISILGSKRTKLGLRDFITLGDFIQLIDVEQNKAMNTVTFSVAGLGMLSGSFTIEASYNASSSTRVDIRYEKSTIVPDQLLKLFQKNYDLLLSIFNPEGWLEITYVDGNIRIGRDDKGNIFLLERISKVSS